MAEHAIRHEIPPVFPDGLNQKFRLLLSEDMSLTDVHQLLQVINRDLREGEFPPLLGGVRDSLVSALNIAYRSTILDVRRQFNRQHPNESHKSQVFRWFFRTNFHPTLVSQLQSEMDLTPYWRYVESEQENSYDRDRLPSVVFISILLMIISLLSGFDATSSIEEDEDARRAVASVDEATIIGQEQIVLPDSSAIVRPVNSVSMEENGSFISQETDDQGAGELLQQSQDLFAIGFEAGRSGNPFLLWPLRTSVDGNTEANIFEHLFHTVSSYNGERTVFNTEIYNMFEIEPVMVFELVEGYALGVWAEDDDVELYRDTVSVVIHTSLDDFYAVCSQVAGACYKGGEAHFKPDGDPGALPHETGHADFDSDLWKVAQHTDDNTFLVGGVEVTVTREWDGNNPGVVLVAETGEIGIVDNQQAFEAMSEIYEQVVFATLGVDQDTTLYSESYDAFANYEVFETVLATLTEDPEIRQEFGRALRAGNHQEVFRITGEMITTEHPDYYAEVEAHFEANPDLASNYYFYFNLGRYQTRDVLRDQVPEPYRSGMVFWGEAASIARRYSTYFADEYYTEDVTFVVTTTGDGIEIDTQDIDTIVELGLGFDDEADQTADHYRWGESSEVMGEQRVEQVVTEYLETGTVALQEDETHQLIVGVIVEEQLEVFFAGEVPQAFKVQTEVVVNNLKIAFSGRDPHATVPYVISRSGESQSYANISVVETTVKTTVFVTGDTWVNDAMWAVYRGVIEQGFDFEDYPVIPSIGIDHLIVGFHDSASDLVLLERFWLPRDETQVAQLSLIDVSHVPDLLAHLMFQASFGRDIAEIETELGEDLAHVVEQMRSDPEYFRNFMFDAQSGVVWSLVRLGQFAGTEVGAEQQGVAPRFYSGGWGAMEASIRMAEAVPWVEIVRLEVDAPPATDQDEFLEVLRPVEPHEGAPFSRAWSAFTATGIDDLVYILITSNLTPQDNGEDG